jgi:zinc transporter, ZIP family
VEVGVYLWRLDARWKTGSVPVSVIGGLMAGLSLMYATAVLVKV